MYSLTDEQKAEYIEKFKKGFWIDREQNEVGFDCQPSELIFQSVELKNSSGKVDCLLTIYEGKFHQVKRMFSQMGNEVIYLKRIKMGNLELDETLELGKYRELTEEEIELISNC